MRYFFFYYEQFRIAYKKNFIFVFFTGKTTIFLTLLFISLSFNGYGQADEKRELSTEKMVDMDFHDLLNVKVISASKKDELIFDAPLSISSINKDEIRRAGATSIMEALRLIPGVIVIEVTNGNYEIHLRGLSNMPTGSALNNATNSITLVMINNRPVYNYFNGGTFWETLPVDLNDVERIEVVRGPSSALYGPNAAEGVINIITRKLDKKGVNVVANVQGGTPLTMITNASVGYKMEKFSVIASANFQQRQRTEDDYYIWFKQKKAPLDSVVTYIPSNKPLTDIRGNNNANDRYPNPGQAQQKFGYNAFLNYDFTKKTTISLNMGGQQSQAQVAFTDILGTPLTVRESATNYVDAKIKAGHFNAMVSDQIGRQNIARGVNGYKLDFNTLDIISEYDFKLGAFTFKPGINFRNAAYDDSRHADVANKEGFINGPKQLENIAGSLRAEYNLNDKFKLIAAVRLDKYNHPDNAYMSYQFISSYRLNDKNLVRVVYSRAYRGPNIYDTYNNQSIFVGKSAPPFAPLSVYSIVSGNENLRLLKIDMTEIGYRSMLTDKINLDIDLFYQVARDYAIPITHAPAYNSDSTVLTFAEKIVNIPLVAKQLGITVSLNYSNRKFQFRPFVTVEQTHLRGVSNYRVSPELSPDKNYEVTHDTLYTGTPTVYGGFYLNYQFSRKVNANLSGYYFSKYSYNNIYSNYTVTPNDGVTDIQSKVLLNIKLAYKPVDKLELFINMRNVLNQTSYEFVHTDKTDFMLLFGLSFIY